MGSSFCVETGEQVSVKGRKKLKRFLHKLGRRSVPIFKSTRCFCFGNAVYKSLEQVESPLKTSENVSLLMVGLGIVFLDVQCPKKIVETFAYRKT